MLIELLLAILAGIIAGTICGLLPGIHINLVGAVLVSSAVFLLNFASPIIIIIFIVSMAITQTFVDFIPSIFLGAPDEETALSVLPGHELLKKGKGYEAVMFAIYGCIFSIPIILIISVLFIYLLPQFEKSINLFIPYILILSSIFLISHETNKIKALIVFILSGFLGIAVLNSNINQPFLPMLTGLFGASSLVIAIKSKVKIQKQTISFQKIKKSKLLKPMIAASLSSPLCCFLPGFGSGQAAVIGASIANPDKKLFLTMLGAINMMGISLSFVVLYSIEKTRTGMAVNIQQITETITLNNLLTIILTICLVGIISFYLTKKLAIISAKYIHKINYTWLSILTLIFISIVVLIFSGFFGFFIFIISASTGLYGILTGVKRINLMGCLIIPVILFYLI
ncbi:MAG: tripartite tricarboxylate transporter permease [Candidatus Pacearchaeota archaeon]